MAILNKIKTVLAKIRQNKKRLFLGTKEKKISKEAKREILGVQEIIVEKAKFSHPQAGQAARIMPQDLVSGYGKDKIVLQVRDPWWIHAYWEVQGSTVERLRNELRDEFHQAKWTLRVYDVSHIIFDGKNAHRFFDIQINEQANNWYIDTAEIGRAHV